ncbi:MAG: AAA family ATPase, partial [Vicinamibacterales bacterium]
MPATTLHDIKTLVLSMHPLVTIETVEEERVETLLGAAAADLGLPLFTWTVTHGLRKVPDGQAIYGTTDPLVLLKHLRALSVEAIFHLKDLLVHLDRAAPVRALRDVAQAYQRSRATLVLSGPSITLPPDLAHLAVPVRLHLPGPDELGRVLTSVVSSLRRTHAAHVQLPPGGRDLVVNALSGLTLNQARQVLARLVLDQGRLAADDVPALLQRKAELIEDGGLLEYLPPDANHFELGGFDRLKAWLRRAAVGFSPEARALNLDPPKGVLLVGVQGCGKSLAARVIARDWQLPLLKLDAARLYDKYIGESEKNLARALELAERLAPVVLWIDEIEKAFAVSGSGDGDGGVSRRLLGTFLTWLQERKDGVFIAATANDVFALPPEFLRKGRFDEIFFVDLPGPAERETIFGIHLGLRRQDPGAFDLPALAAAADGFSGAEIEQAVIAALYRALDQKTGLDTSLLIAE